MVTLSSADWDPTQRGVCPSFLIYEKFLTIKKSSSVYTWMSVVADWRDSNASPSLSLSSDCLVVKTCEERLEHGPWQAPIFVVRGLLPESQRPQRSRGWAEVYGDPAPVSYSSSGKLDYYSLPSNSSKAWTLLELWNKLLDFCTLAINKITSQGRAMDELISHIGIWKKAHCIF